MTYQARPEEFMAKAREAEDQAAKSRDTTTRDSWLKIAQGYRDLARAQGGAGR